MSGDRTILQSHPPVVPGPTAARGMRPGAGNSPIDELCINTIRTLSMDAVQAANSGHPGTPMAMAPVAYCLWQQFLRFDPQDPIWPNRDRFVLSAGHASMLLYSLLHLTGVKAVSKDYETLGEPSVPLEAINGLLLFGLSTAIMFGVLARLLANQLHHEENQPSRDQGHAR